MKPPSGGPADWNPALYSRFEDERTRPARDLLARVPLPEAEVVVDVGCGPGNSTELLARRFPDARLVGIDTSAAMLEAARRRLPDAAFIEADAATWRPDRPVDLLFANASLQWVGDHATLLPRLLGLLRPGGVLALQVPDNLAEPSHRAMAAVAADGPWASRIGRVAAERAGRVLAATDYYDLLARTADVDVWRTTYHHPLASPAEIVSWVSATGLRPFLDPLEEAQRPAFLARYEAAIDREYPARRDGRRVLAFPRLFVVARMAA